MSKLTADHLNMHTPYVFHMLRIDLLTAQTQMQKDNSTCTKNNSSEDFKYKYC